MTPTPTEYKKQVFRSKSEAVFARAMDLSHTISRWNYDPQGHSHVWDFEIYVGSYRRLILVEYKPSEPTMTYIGNLIKKTRESAEKWAVNQASRAARHAEASIAMKRPANHEFALIDSYVVWGSPWSGIRFEGCSYVAYPVFSSFAKYGWGDYCPLAASGEDSPFSYDHLIGEILGINEEIAQQAKAYRFDLTGVPQ